MTAMLVTAAFSSVAPAIACAGAYVALQAALTGPQMRAMLARARTQRTARDDAMALARDVLLDSYTHGSLRADIQHLEELALGGSPTARTEGAHLEALRSRLDTVSSKWAASDPTRRSRPALVDASVMPGNPNLLTHPYGARSSHPWLRDRAVGALLEQIGVVLDEVRVLHNVEIERAVLLLTFWSRLLLIGLSPLLGAVTAADPPLANGLSVADVPWIFACVISLVTAVKAGVIADGIMDRGKAGVRLRRRLTMVEAPVALALFITCPAWSVCVFASGWHNYMHRPIFSWPRLVGLIGVLVVLQGAGLALDGVALVPAAREVTATVAAIAITGGSYGAMLPISFVVFIDTVISGAAHRYRVARAAREDLVRAAESLERLAEAFEEDRRLADVDHAVGVAMDAGTRLRHAVSAIERAGAVASSGLRDLVLGALHRAGFEYILAVEHWTPEAATHAEPQFEPDDLGTRRVKARRHRRTLEDLLRLVLDEARTHGSGSVAIRMALDGDRLRLIVANPIDEPRTPGAGTGTGRIEHACRALPEGFPEEPEELADGAAFGYESEPAFVRRLSCSAGILQEPPL